MPPLNLNYKLKNKTLLPSGMNKHLLILLSIILLVPSVLAIEMTYDFIVEDNGDSLVIIELTGSGVVNIPKYDDVDEIKVKGALYKLNDESIDVSIGYKKKAYVLYQTSYLTKKQGSTWSFQVDGINASNSSISLPSNTHVLSTTPSSFIDSGNYTKIMFGNTDNLEVEYKFSSNIIDEDDSSQDINIGVYLLFLVVGIIFIVSIMLITKFNKKISNKNNILKTLSRNEKLIIQTLIDNKGSMRRSDLERSTKIAKSSLANTLNNLEIKNYLDIDKIHTTHFIRLKRWFYEL